MLIDIAVDDNKVGDQLHDGGADDARADLRRIKRDERIVGSLDCMIPRRICTYMLIVGKTIQSLSHIIKWSSQDVGGKQA